MKTITTTPVIFRCFGRETDETSYRLPDFLFGYVAAGHGFIRIGSQIREIRAGNSFLIARREEATVTLLPDAPASSRHPDQSPRLLLPDEEEEGYFHTINICFSEAEVEDFFLHTAAPEQVAAPATRLFQVLPDHPLLHGLALLLEDGIRQGFRAGSHFVKMKIQECIYILVALDERLHNWLAARNHLQKINLSEFMEKNFRQNVPLPQFARACGRSLATFRRDCLRELGTTPSRWIIARRLDEAHRLLYAGQRPCDILTGLGFESFSHFTRRFKQRFGYLPSECPPAFDDPENKTQGDGVFGSPCNSKKTMRTCPAGYAPHGIVQPLV